MTVSFATPLGALAAAAVVLPFLGVLAAERRGARVRSLLGLPPPRRRVPRAWAWAAAALFLLLGLAAAQPVLATEGTARARADAEAYVVVDASRSMLAAAPGGSTRFARAVELAARVRASLPDVRTGLASLTDRVLPHLFPTADGDAFALVRAGALGVERPPPAGAATVATDFGALRNLGDHNFFSARTVYRLAVLVTDGESRRFDAEALARALESHGVELVVVGVWSPRERIPGEPYRPDPASRGPLAAVARAGAGGRVFGERELPAVVAAARAALGHGPTASAGRGRRVEPLAPWVVVAAALPLALLLAGGGAWVGFRREPRWD